MIGNVGTYDMMAYTALGTTVNLGARLEGEAIPGLPCISPNTYKDVLGKFAYRSNPPRKITPKGLEELGEMEVWDVVGPSVGKP